MYMYSVCVLPRTHAQSLSVSLILCGDCQPLKLPKPKPRASGANRSKSSKRERARERWSAPPCAAAGRRGRSRRSDGDGESALSERAFSRALSLYLCVEIKEQQ